MKQNYKEGLYKKFTPINISQSLQSLYSYNIDHNVIYAKLEFHINFFE
jgi:hypothetical protein